MSDGFGLVVVDTSGRVISHGLAGDIPGHIVREAIGISVDTYRLLSAIIRELGYKLPNRFTLHMGEYEVTVFIRHNRLVIAIFHENRIVAKTYTSGVVKA